MTTAVVAFGSNVSPVENVVLALARIRSRFRVLGESEVVRTKPIGFPDQPDFHNGVVLIETEMSRPDLKSWLRALEEDLGRIRTDNRFGPRTIDLDIVVWNGEIVDGDVFERGFLSKAIRQVLPEMPL